jgi:Bacterial regulatory proteins, luxR family
MMPGCKAAAQWNWCKRQMPTDKPGGPNPEIGGEVFLSARTVEWHLRNIFTKLDVSSRHELDAALTRLGHPLAVATRDR